MRLAMSSACISCGREFGASEARHHPCYWGCDEPLRTLRKSTGGSVCVECLPDRFKRGNASWKPILTADDLPKVGDPVPPNTVFVDR